MSDNYSYPIDLDWSTGEMTSVVNMWRELEYAYEKGVNPKEFMVKYKQFKEVVKSIGEEKKLGREFEELSGYSLYRTVQEVKKNLDKAQIKMTKGGR